MWRFLDSMKSLVIRLLLLLFITVLLAVIVNGIMKVGEIKNGYDGEYKNMYPTVDGKAMNLYVSGSGEKTILIMPGFGVGSPEVYYKPIVNMLDDKYRVVVVDYLGYGFSSENKKDRTSETIINEVRQALVNAEVFGPYILMPHSMSNIYATHYANTYPNEVKGIIGIDGVAPNLLKEQAYQDELTESVLNTRLCYAAEKFAIIRILKTLDPAKLEIDRFDNNAYFTDEDRDFIDQYFCVNYLTTTMLIEAGEMQNNIKALEDTVYNNQLPVLQIIATETDEASQKLKEEGTVEKTKKELMIESLANNQIQMTVDVEGGHMLNFDNPTAVAAQAMSFIDNYINY